MIFLPQTHLDNFESFLKKHFLHIPLSQLEKNQNLGQEKLLESIKYSLFSGGKRFRPMVGYLLGDALNLEIQNLTPWLAAVECIHTYSLIHDDLPSMDNDSVRRGKPTNHMVFGEATALLAGDALLTEAFTLVSQYYSINPSVGLSLVTILSSASGFQGMVGGQALDLAVDTQHVSESSLNEIHQLKTGALIQSVAKGVAAIAQLPTNQNLKLEQFGSLLGRAFQIKDDLLDFNIQNKDPKNLASHLGFQETTKVLNAISLEAQETLLFMETNRLEPLNALIRYNQEREL